MPSGKSGGIVPLLDMVYNADLPANRRPITPQEVSTQIGHAAWRDRGAELLDKIGPAIFIAHSAGGPFPWLVAEARPHLVKAAIVIEPASIPFVGGNRWGLTTIEAAYDPPVRDPSELVAVKVNPTEEGVRPYYVQAEPARRLKNLQSFPTVLVTAEASFDSPGYPGTVAYLKQAGCKAEELRLVDFGIRGNGHMMMVETNNRAVLKPILQWIGKNVPAGDPKPAVKAKPQAALALADQGCFWVGAQEKPTRFGTIISGQMFVQYLIPAKLRHETPIVLVHGGSGQMLHYMGRGDGVPGWAHYYVQQGYKVYLVDRPGHGRSPFHPEALGPIGPQPSYELISAEFRRVAAQPERRWPGSGEIGDPLLDQFMASQNAMPSSLALQHELWASRGAALLDRIGPAIIQTHSAGGPFGWLVANERPELVRGIVVYECATTAFSEVTPWGLTATPMKYDPPISAADELRSQERTGADGKRYRVQQNPPRKLVNLGAIPTLFVEAPSSGRSDGRGIVEFLQQAGAPAEYLNLKDHGILGNGHFAMLDTNNLEALQPILRWVDARASTASKARGRA
jgi:pimeloyl-ACP methyl ester carboxylesterase